MRSLHLTLMIFCHLILASFIIYSRFTSASPVAVQAVQEPVVAKDVAVQAAPKPASVEPVKMEAPVAEQTRVAPAVAEREPVKRVAEQLSAKSLPATKPEVVEQPAVAQTVVAAAQSPAVAAVKPEPVVVVAAAAPIVKQESPIPAQVQPAEVAPVAKPVERKAAVEGRSAEPAAAKEQPKEAAAAQVAAAMPVPEALVGPAESSGAPAAVQSAEPVKAAEGQASAPVAAAPLETVQAKSAVVVGGPAAAVVKGGLGPLHLLAASLCAYHPEREQAEDETIKSLYNQRASVRRSLFDFMSLKFTNLEKLSSLLHAAGGLEVVPLKTSDVPVSGGVASLPLSQGWPVVGRCTAHDLKLMAEAAWCECAEESNCPAKAAVPVPAAAAAADKPAEPMAGSKHSVRVRRSSAAPAPDSPAAPAPAVAAAPVADQSAVVSRILHVKDVKDVPLVESSILQQRSNLTAQPASQEAASTLECRRNALKLTKALFNHLAEDQRNVSESWGKLRAQMSEDECARKRMIDIVKALSGYRSESTMVRRDNVEFAFAMDDLRTKVLESQVNVPLTFDKQFIEVGQFLQQSVKLMLANIEPDRARLASMRYRSLMPGPVSADDQCIELHQRLLAKNYPTDCNPNHFGQLPDVLRMTASSLELWSIDSELSKRSTKGEPQQEACQQSKSYANECIANLVAS